MISACFASLFVYFVFISLWIIYITTSIYFIFILTHLTVLIVIYIHSAIIITLQMNPIQNSANDLVSYILYQIEHLMSAIWCGMIWPVALYIYYVLLLNKKSLLYICVLLNIPGILLRIIARDDRIIGCFYTWWYIVIRTSCPYPSPQ